MCRISFCRRRFYRPPVPTTIAASLLAAILAEAAAAPAQEVCGLLFGSSEAIEGAVSTANMAADRHRTFEVDPAALFAALKAQRAGGPCVIGHYHSHPSGCAEPSASDAAAAEPGRLWLIVAGTTARLWLAAGGGFHEIELLVTAH